MTHEFSFIFCSSFFFLKGLVAVTSTALARAWSPSNSKISSSFLFWSLCLISLGQGGYNPSLQAFGTDQLDNDEELPSDTADQKSTKKSLFFQWWYFGVCTGSLLGVTLMAYIQDTFGWVLGFAIPTIAMIVSIAFFSCGSRIYAYRAGGNLNVKLFQRLTQAIKARTSKLLSSRITLSDDNSNVVELE